MLLCSSYILNHTQQREQWRLHPWCACPLQPTPRRCVVCAFPDAFQADSDAESTAFEWSWHTTTQCELSQPSGGAGGGGSTSFSHADGCRAPPRPNRSPLRALTTRFLLLHSGARGRAVYISQPYSLMPIPPTREWSKLASTSRERGPGQQLSASAEQTSVLGSLRLTEPTKRTAWFGSRRVQTRLTGSTTAATT